MKQPPIKTKELSGSTVQIADGQNWEIASITAYGENAQGGTTEAPVALTGVDNVHVCGRNLFPCVETSGVTNGITKTVNTDGSITLSGTATDRVVIFITNRKSPIVLSKGTYTIGIGATIPDGCAIALGHYHGNKYIGGLMGMSAGKSYKSFQVSNITGVLEGYFEIKSGTTVNTTIYPMLNLGESPLPYEPYQGSVTPLPIPRPLHKVGDVRDVCQTRVKSVYDKHIVLDGSEDWRKRTDIIITGGSCFYPNNFIADAISNAPIAVSAYFVGRTNSTTKLWEARQVGSNVGIQFNAPFTEVSDFKAWLAAHPLTVYYQSTAYDGTNGLDVMESTYNVGYIESYAGESITTAWISSTGALSTGAEVAYVLSSPETYATDPLDIDNAAGPLIVMTGGELEVTLTHRMLTPYTAWAIRYDSEGEYTGDFFNVEDYDRIKQNIEYLREYAYFLYGGFTMRGMVAVTVESYGYASTIDALDANLEAIAANTFRPPDMMPVKQWRGNQPPPGADDWNRIENTCLLLFEQFERQFACLPKLAFELKGSAF